MNFNEAQAEFISLIQKTNKCHVAVFMKWLKNVYCSDEAISSVETTNEDIQMRQIQEDLRSSLPCNATLASESVICPQVGPTSDCDPATTVHVDNFLYEDESVIDELVEEGKMSRNYCRNCRSHNVAPLTFISHSASLQDVKYIYQFLLPDLRGKTVVDVGSRLGPMLYGGYLYSAASGIVGVEINADLCNLQLCIIDKYCMTDRVKVICADIATQGELLKTADVVIMHNVFEFFAPLDVQKRIWQFLSQTLRKKGCLLVTTPTLEKSLLPLEINICLEEWLRKIDTTGNISQGNTFLYGDCDSEESDFENICLYEVL